MKWFYLFCASIKEQFRSPLITLLSLLSTPLLIVIYALLFPSDSPQFDLLLVNQGQENPALELHLREYPQGEVPALIVETIDDRDWGLREVQAGRGDLMMVLPEDFPTSLMEMREGLRSQSAPVEFLGDFSNPNYAVAAIMAYSALDSYINQETGRVPPLNMVETALGQSSDLSPMDPYIPGLLNFSLIVLIFQISMALTRLKETKLIQRLQLTQASMTDILAGHSLSMLVLGLGSFFLSLFFARLFGSSLGGRWVLTLVTALFCGLAITGASMMVAAFSKTTGSAFILANLPLMLFMFLSGVMYPIKAPELFRLGQVSVELFDFLPTTHGVELLRQIWIMESSLEELLYPLISLVVLSLAFLLLGIQCYTKRRSIK